MTALLLVIFGISNAQTTQWYGYALGSFGGEANIAGHSLKVMIV